MTLYITKNDQRLGPYTVAEAQALLAAGTVLPTDWAWYEGLATWIPLAQVPGLVSAAAPLPRTERPVLVWVICLLFFCCTPFSLIGLVMLPMMAAGTIPVAEAQRHYFQSQTSFDYTIAVLNLIATLTWAVLLFMLKRQSLYLFLGLFVLGLLMLIYNIIAKDWLAAVGVVGLITAAITWAINFLILYYNWHLYRKGVLR